MFDSFVQVNDIYRSERNSRQVAAACIEIAEHCDITIGGEDATVDCVHVLIQASISLKSCKTRARIFQGRQ